VREHIWADIKVGLWIIYFILELILEVDVVRLESLEAEDENGWCLVDLDSLCRLYMILAHIAVP